MFTVAMRDAIRARLLEKATGDARVVSAAWVGGSAGGERDAFSDLDLTLGVAEGVAVAEVLADWTEVVEAHGAAHLFDLRHAASLYRVFLLPGCLQIDLSFTPAPHFGSHGPRFELVFGEAREHPPSPPPSPRKLFGLAVHHAVRARLCIERGRRWQAEYWLGLARDHTLELACLRLGEVHAEGRGFDRLPPEVLDPMAAGLPASLEPEDLLRALRAVVDALVREAVDPTVEDRLRELV